MIDPSGKIFLTSGFSWSMFKCLSIISCMFGPLGLYSATKVVSRFGLFQLSDSITLACVLVKLAVLSNSFSTLAGL